MKTIGVVGGIGPQATMDFEARLHQVAQQRIPQRGNSGYPRMIVYWHRDPPVLLDENGRPRQPFQLHPDLILGLRQLGTVADFLVITANGPHILRKEIEQAAERPVLSMVERTVAEVRSRGWKKVGVIAMGSPLVYAGPLGEAGVAHESLPPELQGRMDRAMLGVMEGRAEDSEARRVAHEALAALRARGVEAIILGCTELPILLGKDAEQPDLLNPIQLLAEAAIEEATR